MANLTLAIDDRLLKRARIAALQRDTSVNAVVREFLRRFVGDDGSAAALDEFLREAERSTAGSGGRGHARRRDDLYADRVADRGGNGRG